MNRFSEQVVVVTGGANGIGAATVRRFLDEGARVAVIDLEETALHVSFGGHPRCLAVAGDCTDAETLKSFFARTESSLGPVDVLFNNVGQSARERASEFIDSSEEVWRFVIDVSLMTAMRAARLAAPGMRGRGRGRIINMSSDAALAGDAGLVDYAAAKMGVIGFTRALARELAAHGVTVNAVAPGAIRTRAHERIPPDALAHIVQTTPAGFVAAPEDVAGVVAFLASADARYVTGQTLVIDGGRWMV
jgi:3-oxoacyl-[acyl-carrier protein] reductase